MWLVEERNGSNTQKDLQHSTRNRSVRECLAFLNNGASRRECGGNLLKIWKSVSISFQPSL